MCEAPDRRQEANFDLHTYVYVYIYIYIHIIKCQSQELFSCHMIFFGIIRPTPSNRRNGLPGNDSYSKVSQLLAPWGCVCVRLCVRCVDKYIYIHTHTHTHGAIIVAF